MAGFTGIEKVAERAGVSISTVSRVLNGSKPVSDLLRKKVEEAVAELDYHKDDMAGSMKRRKTKNIAVILPQLQMLYFPEILRGIESSVEQRGYKLLYFSTHYDFSLEQEYIHMLKTSWVDGIVLDSCCAVDQMEEHRRLLESETGRRAVPVVSLENNFGSEKIGCVTIDNHSLAREATAHLTGLGHRRIAMLTGRMDLQICVENVNGYRDALQEAGIAVDEKLIVTCDYTPQDGYRAVYKLKEQGVDYSAVFAANDAMAVGAIKALKELGLRIPQDVAVVGFDNTFVGTLIEPSLSSVDVPLHSMGYEAAEMLLNALEEGGEKLDTVILDGKLVVRNSSVADKRVEWNLENWYG